MTIETLKIENYVNHKTIKNDFIKYNSALTEFGKVGLVCFKTNYLLHFTLNLVINCVINKEKEISFSTHDLGFHLKKFEMALHLKNMTV